MSRDNQADKTMPPIIPGGCVLLARKMLDSDLMDQSPLVVKLWVWLLLRANWKDRDQLERGQLVTTISEMREAMSHYAGWRKIVPTKDEIRTAYEALTKATRITTRRTTRGMVITVINYSAYQDLLAYAPHTEASKENATKPPAAPHDTEEGEKRNNKGRRFTQPTLEDVTFPEWMPREEWSGFEEMRRRIKKPLTDRAVKRAIQKLEDLRSQGHCPEAVLDQSTFNNWSDLYPLKIKTSQTVNLPERHEGQGTSMDELKRMGAL